MSEINSKFYGGKLFPYVYNFKDNIVMGQLINPDFEQVNLPYIYCENDMPLNQQYSMMSIVSV